MLERDPVHLVRPLPTDRVEHAVAKRVRERLKRIRNVPAAGTVPAEKTPSGSYPIASRDRT